MEAVQTERFCCKDQNSNGDAAWRSIKKEKGHGNKSLEADPVQVLVITACCTRCRDILKHVLRRIRSYTMEFGRAVCLYHVMGINGAGIAAPRHVTEVDMTRSDRELFDDALALETIDSDARKLWRSVWAPFI